MQTHEEYKYSVTVRTDDEPLAVTLRALAWYCQESGNRQIAVAGTKLPDWKRDGHKITFHFDSSIYRQNFLDQAIRLFCVAWEKVGLSDDDPAERQG